MSAMKLFDRSEMRYFPLSERKNKVFIERDYVDEKTYKSNASPELRLRAERIADELRKAKEAGASRMCAFGAHAIKNGLGPLLSKFVAEGWFTHLATNGAGVIHDWEFAFQGQSSEDVRANVELGQFGTWQETGFSINAAIAAGAYEGLGYGEAVGKMISKDGIDIPSAEELEKVVCDKNAPLSKRAAAADFLNEIRFLDLPDGRFLAIAHPYKRFSVQAACYENGVPFTDHPMFGHDIIYTHKANKGAAIGRTAEVDFLRYVASVSGLQNGVYLSIGSAVMSPMIFEKALSMARNVAIQNGQEIRNAAIHVFDLQRETWDWGKGEPPADNPAYYLRFMKTFSRMGCPVDYTSADNRDVLVELYRALQR
ncbi:hypothetical protein [Treponema socranskii]|uniref:hypothetical protein n=1 Tax=Treponema socranskii TaxID=53419 RepID=UPI003D8AE5C5